MSQSGYKLWATLFFILSGLNAGFYVYDPDPVSIGFAVASFGVGIACANER